MALVKSPQGRNPTMIIRSSKASKQIKLNIDYTAPMSKTLAQNLKEMAVSLKKQARSTGVKSPKPRTVLSPSRSFQLTDKRRRCRSKRKMTSSSTQSSDKDNGALLLSQEEVLRWSQIHSHLLENVRDKINRTNRGRFRGFVARGKLMKKLNCVREEKSRLMSLSISRSADESFTNNPRLPMLGISNKCSHDLKYTQNRLLSPEPTMKSFLF